MMQAPSTLTKIFRPFLEFTKAETFSGIMLLVLTAFAIVWANSPYYETYFGIWHLEFSLGFVNYYFTKDLHFWINDGLMAIFFLVVGLEIKRELIAGELSDLKSAALPIFAAAGGMLFPALIFSFFNSGTEWMAGWAIPTATDIAFSIGILSLLGNRVPLKLKIFLVALAIVDDMGAVIIIAIFYSSDISIMWLSIAAGAIMLQFIFNYFHQNRIFLYVITGTILWIAFYNAGIHATIAGVVTAAAIPARRKIKEIEFISSVEENLDEVRNAVTLNKPYLVHKEQQEAIYSIEEACEQAQAPLLSMEHKLHPYVTYIIIPLFALSNAGVQISGGIMESISTTLALGIIFGLFIGKPLGITLLAWIAVKIKIAELPAGSSFSHILGLGFIAGIGFTMSLFISNLAFSQGANNDLSKIGILAGSLLSGVVGYFFLRLKKPT